jgi:hypothetical protein
MSKSYCLSRIDLADLSSAGKIPCNKKSMITFVSGSLLCANLIDCLSKPNCSKGVLAVGAKESVSLIFLRWDLDVGKGRGVNWAGGFNIDFGSVLDWGVAVGL